MTSYIPVTAAPGSTACYHCGEPVRGAGWPVEIDGVAQPTCCAGCQAVARLIVDNGLAAYYAHRTAPAQSQQAPPEALRQLALYDRPEVQRAFVRMTGGECREAALLLDGITCAACVWLVERRLAQIDGVASVQVNYATRRARVRWDDARVKLSAILAAVADIGYGAQPYDTARSESALARERRTLLWRLFVAGFGMMQVMMYAYPAYVDRGAMPPDIAALMRLASFVLTVPVVLWSAVPFYAGAWRELKGRRVGMDMPVALGIVGAFAGSVHATIAGSGAVYFDSVTMFVFLLLAARYLELDARSKAAEAQERLARLAPVVAERYRCYPGSAETVQVPAVALAPGEHVLVRPGAAFPADGCVVEGEGGADESLLTGEARPVRKRGGDRVVAGSVNLHAPLTVRVERIGEETMLAAIVRLMDRAQAEKPRIAHIADRAARAFVAALLLITAIATAAWLAIDPARAPWIAVAILVVTCPCALSLAVPAASTAATGALYREELLVTRGHALEALARATHFVFDKTGTLTQRRMALARTVPLGTLASEDCLALAAALEARSEHPAARAIVAASGMVRSVLTTDVRHDTGSGIEARIAGRVMRIGSVAYVAALSGAVPPAVAAEEGCTTVALGDAGGCLALFVLDEALRPEARTTIERLKRAGRRVALLSGDRDARVRRLARDLGIDEAVGEATPEAKLAYVRALQSQGAVVAMIGDGVNDAPVLAQADVSAAFADGTELAQLNADVLVMSPSAAPLAVALDTAQRLARVIRQNLAWAVAYNLAAVPLAVSGHVTPLLAAAGMSISSLTVVLNALRLLPRQGHGNPARARTAPAPAVATEAHAAGIAG